MELKLEDILNRVNRTEQDRAEYRRKAEQWERMYRLEVFNRSTKEAIERDGQEQVTLPGPYNVIQLGQRLISSTPRIDVPPLAGTEDADKTAQLCEEWLTAMWQQINRQQQRNIVADAAFWTLVRGRNVFEVKWVEDQLPKALKKKRLPFLVRTLDPLNVGMKRGPLYTLWAYHKYEEERILVLNRYPDLDLDDGQRADSISDLDTEMLTVIDFWWIDPDSGKVWNAILVGDRYAKEPFETEYPDIPIIESFGDTSPLNNEAFRGLSILHPITDLWPYQCRLASQMATGMLYYFWPPVTVQNEHGAPVGDIKIRPGETTPVPWGTKIEQHQLSPNVPLAQAMMSQIDGAMQESTFPGVMYGKAPGELQAGFGVSLLADQAKGRIRAPLENLEFAIAQVNEMVLNLIAAFGGKEGVDVWGMNQAAGSPYRLKLSREQIKDFHETVVSLKPQVASDDMQRQTLGLRLVEAGIISKETFRIHYAGIALPFDEAARVEWEQALQAPPMQPYVFSAAMRQRMGPDWGKLIEVDKPPAPPFGPPPGPPAGAGGPPPGPMGPGGPPPGPPPMQGPPPQGPPPMLGPPPGGPPPGGGLPPELQGIPPEMLLAAVQMFMQQMQQQGGGPGGPPPQGPPPGPPLLQGGPPPGGPGAGMPSGQPEQMLTPPQGGGIPAEIQGQLTPEALNMPADTNPLDFARLTGRDIPPADELAILAGQKNVGNKKRKAK